MAQESVMDVVNGWLMVNGCYIDMVNFQQLLRLSCLKYRFY